jgi:dodecin
MSDNSVYKIIQIVGSSTESWEKAAVTAIKRASKSLKDLRIAEVEKLDLKVENGDIMLFRVSLKLSFKYLDD